MDEWQSGDGDVQRVRCGVTGDVLDTVRRRGGYSERTKRNKNVGCCEQDGGGAAGGCFDFGAGREDTCGGCFKITGALPADATAIASSSVAQTVSVVTAQDDMMMRIQLDRKSG